MNFLDDIKTAPVKIVPPKGSLSAPICIVCDVPDKDDVKYGQPLMGRAGNLLRKLMLQAQISSNDVYITYVIKVKPPGYKIDPYFYKGNFTADGLKWVDALKTEISQSKANVFVAVGPASSKALCGKAGVTKWRGSVLPSTMLPGKKVIPTIAPGSAMAQYIYRFHIAHDLKRVKEQAAFPEIVRPNRNLIIEKGLQFTLSWFDQFDATGLREICLDIECTGQLQLSCISFAWNPMEAISVPVTKFSIEEEIVFWRRVAKYICSEKYTIIGQNVMFDIDFMMKRYNLIPRCRIDDTFSLQGVIFPDFPKGLDYLCSVYTNEPYYKEDGKEWKKVKDWPMFWRYNAMDSAVTLESWQVLKAMAIREGYWKTYEMTTRLHHTLLYPMYRGMKATPDKIKETQDKIEATIFETQQALDKIILPKMLKGNEVVPSEVQVDSHSGQKGYLNVNSPKQMKDYFYGILNITPYMDKKRPTCNDKALQRLAKGTSARAPLEEATLCQKLIKAKKFRGTYLDIDFDEDNRLRCTYVPRGTIFGRLASRSTIFHTGTNMQNIPQEFKGFLVADSGNIMFEMDKVQAEWVATAYIAKDAEMIRIIENGLDPHIETTHLITGLPRDLIMEEAALLKHLTNAEQISMTREKFAPIGSANRTAYKQAIFIPRTMSARQCGKKSNHGFNYGLMHNTFALQNEVPEADAFAAYNGYHRAYPGLKIWYETVKMKLQKDRILTNCFGRKIRMVGRWDNHLWNQAYSFEPQSTVVDMINTAMYNAYNLSAPAQDIYLRPMEILAQVHDSVVFQYPIHEGNYIIAKGLVKFRELMEPTLKVHGREFKIATDCKMGLSWGDMRDCDIQTYDGAFRDLNTFTEEIVYD